VSDSERPMRLETGRSTDQYRARICKLLRSPRIDFKESIPPGCVAWRLVRQPYSYSVPSPHKKIPAHKNPPQGSKYHSMQEKKARQIRYTVILSKHKRTGGLSQFAVFCHTSANCTKGYALDVPFPIHSPCCYSGAVTKRWILQRLRHKTVFAKLKKSAIK
jgi:hypothetical protein